MKQILTSLCLTVALLLGSAGVSWSDETEDRKQYWEKSQTYFSEGKSVEADFYLALYLMEEADTQIGELFKKLDQRKIPSLYFIDGDYSHEFFGIFLVNLCFNGDLMESTTVVM